jgi:hypothetical protein
MAITLVERTGNLQAMFVSLQNNLCRPLLRGCAPFRKFVDV